MFVVLCWCYRGRGVRRKQKFGDFSDWVNVFKPGTGTITVYENSGGTRGPQLFQLKGIPLTPGPLVVVIKVASSVVKEPDKCVQHHGDPYGLFGCSARSETCILRLCFVFAFVLAVATFGRTCRYWPPALPDAVETIAAS